MKKIEELARTEYFAHSGAFASGLDIFTEGYGKGYREALREVREAIADQPNNLQKLSAVYKMIKEVNDGK